MSLLTTQLRYAALLCICTVLCTNVVAQTPQGDANSTVTFRGTVVNSVTGEPLGHALVSSPDNRFGTFTDDHGHFEFTVTPKKAGEPGEVESYATTFIARKPGYLQPENAPLSVAASAADMTLSLQPESLIVGRVVLPSADAPDFVRVGLYRRNVEEGRGSWAPAGERIVNSKGEFRFAGLHPGSYRLFTYEAMDRDPQDIVPGGPQFAYPPVYYPAATDFGASAVIALTAGRTFHTELKLIKQQYYDIRIPVANIASNTPVQVRVLPNGSSGPGFALGYVPDDRAIRGALPSGTYVVEAANFPPFMDGSMTITVNGSYLQTEPMVLTNARSIPVDVTTEFRHPEHQQVYMTRLSPMALGSALSDISLEPEEGAGYPAALRPQKTLGDAIALQDVRPGRYWVRVDARHGYVTRLTSGGIDLLEHPLVVQPGVPSEPVEVTLGDSFATLEGVVEGAPAASGAPVSNNDVGGVKPYAFVYCIPLEPSAHFTEINTSSDGSLSGPPVPPGLYRVLAFKTLQRELAYHDPAFLRSIESKGIVVRLAEDGKEKVRVPVIGDWNP
jgi:hypothetical protein